MSKRGRAWHRAYQRRISDLYQRARNPQKSDPKATILFYQLFAAEASANERRMRGLEN